MHSHVSCHDGSCSLMYALQSITRCGVLTCRHGRFAQDDHTARVVKRLSSLTHRMDVLNNVRIFALKVLNGTMMVVGFVLQKIVLVDSPRVTLVSIPSDPSETDASLCAWMILQRTRQDYVQFLCPDVVLCAQSLSTFWGANGSPAKGAALPSVRIVYSSADKISKVVGERRDKGLPTGSTQGPRLIEVRLRLKAQAGDARNQILEALGRTPDLASPKHTPSKKLME
jgi:hypothetical protein